MDFDEIFVLMMLVGLCYLSVMTIIDEIKELRERSRAVENRWRRRLVKRTIDSMRLLDFDFDWENDDADYCLRCNEGGYRCLGCSCNHPDYDEPLYVQKDK